MTNFEVTDSVQRILRLGLRDSCSAVGRVLNK